MNDKAIDEQSFSQPLSDPIAWLHVNMKPRKPSAKTREEKIIEASVAISRNKPAGDDLGFMHPIMCQLGLPRSKVEQTSSFSRISGNAALMIEAGKLWNGNSFVQQPVPYGSMPRLMLIWMNTYAVRHKTQEIPLGKYASDFLKKLGKIPNDGIRGSYSVYRIQLQALAACRISLGFNLDGKAYTCDSKPIKCFEAWIPTTDEQSSWPSSVTLSDEYYQTLIEHAVPIDMRALLALKGSSLAMDVYVWLAERLHRISGRPMLLYWENIREQFAQEYDGKHAQQDFKKKFLRALQAALAEYPQARVKIVTGGLLLMASPPPVPYKTADLRKCVGKSVEKISYPRRIGPTGLS